MIAERHLPRERNADHVMVPVPTLSLRNHVVFFNGCDRYSSKKINKAFIIQAKYEAFIGPI